ncbi:isoleucine--tRNA ligase [Candidatus Woesebacteria bacterium]|nr:isoleucine--tRNA ligase [Candidatus Woesebacteria bacterium]QQG47139.1 MAG: isoleucine--tRNA ligase [Candidatus Woesebacteria bacterium]
MAKKQYFDSVDLKINFPEEEKKLLKFWYENDVVAKYLNKNKTSKKYFSFMDGPITANNPMGVHHAWGRTYKDLWQRFNNMRGFRERFQNGFDCQGLWVEVEVEKELGLRNKKDIEALVPGNKKESIAKFVNLCKERVERFSNIQTQQSKRLGNFMDWDNSYFTMSDENNYTIWHFLKVCHEKGWIYKGTDSVPWCPRCETAISQHEMLTEDYKEITHKSVYLEFPIVDRSREYLLVWTTTPWTIPANIAVAVDEKMDYVLVEGKTGDKYWIVKERLDAVFGKDFKKKIKTVKGKELVGLKYTSAFDDISAIAKVAKENEELFHKVIATDPLILPIAGTEGTGLVHTAVSAGAEDFKLGKKYGLPMIPVIQDNADYLPGLNFLSGQNAKKHPEIIIDYLLSREKENWIFKVENYTHRYPACWRCKTELVWKVADEWYISMDKVDPKDSKKRTLRKEMVDVAKKINWIPKFGLDRELDWLSNMHDWLISKPNRYWGLALPIYECKKCGNFEVIGSKEELKEKAVEGWKNFDGHSPHKPWIDEVKIKCDKCDEIVDRLADVGNVWLDAGIVPFSTISENNQGDPLYKTDKTKWQKWFPVDFITESFPGQFKNWFYSLIAMATVLENKNPFKSVLGFASLLAEDGRPMHKSWGNAIEFNEGADKIGVDVMRWMYVRQNPTDNLLFGFKIADEVRRKFHLKLWNIYNYFVTYANLDNWDPLKNKDNSQNILDKWIISRLNEVIKKTTKDLEKYDAYSASSEIENFVDDLSNWYIRRSREREDRENFYNTTYQVLVTLSKLLAPFTPFVADIIYKNLTKKESVHLSDWPKAKLESKEIIDQMTLVRAVTEKAHSLRKEKSIPLRQPLLSLKTSYEFTLDLKEILKEELNVKDILKGKKAAELDTTITPELEEEAKARELIRKIQAKRKEMNVDLTQKVEISNEWFPKDEKLTQKIIEKTLATSLQKGEFSVKVSG